VIKWQVLAFQVEMPILPFFLVKLIGVMPWVCLPERNIAFDCLTYMPADNHLFLWGA
jgi:hypothetical protein